MNQTNQLTLDVVRDILARMFLSSNTLAWRDVLQKCAEDPRCPKSQSLLMEALVELGKHDIVDIDLRHQNITRGLNFAFLTMPTSNKPLLEVDYRIGGVSFSAEEIEQLRQELLALFSNHFRQTSHQRVIQKSYNIKGVEFTESELQYLASVLCNSYNNPFGSGGMAVTPPLHPKSFPFHPPVWGGFGAMKR